MILRKHQEEALKQVLRIMDHMKICYLVGEVRTGKTLVAINTAYHRNATSVLFVTKKAAISSIKSDLLESGLSKYFESFDVINYEQIKNVKRLYKLIIYDEAHTMGSFPKPSLRTKMAKQKFAGVPTLFLSGTPTPESYSQLYHQFWVTGNLSPWFTYISFYAWAKKFVIPKKIYISMGLQINDYSNTTEEVVKMFQPYKVTMTQKDAGFNGTVKEKIHLIPLPDQCKSLVKELRKDGLSKSKSIITDTAAKLMSSIHQICSGTFIDSEYNRKVISTYKVDYIKNNFSGKIVIFYVYIAEGDLLKKVLNNQWTDIPEDFNSGKKQYFIKQVISGKEGINLSTADHLIFFNISFSAVAYWQGRARSQSIHGGDKLVHWLFSDVGIEQKIYKTVCGKKNFTKRHFNERDYDQL